MSIGGPHEVLPPHGSNAERLRQLPRWLYRYNHRRPHGGVGGVVPASRL